MKLKDIKTGMKVKLLGKHAAGDNYDNIEDFYFDYSNNNYRDRISIETLKKQGYGYVVRVANNGEIIVDECEDGIGWCFLLSDIEPYEEVNITQDKKSETSKEKVVSKKTQIKEFFSIQPNQEKTPKEWLMTPLAVFTTRSGEECVTLGDKFGYTINSGISLVCVDADYDEDLNDIVNEPLYYDVMKITYHNKLVWQRKEEYFTLVEAIKFNKKVKHKDWHEFYEINDVLINLAEEQNDFIIEALSEKVWEVR